MLKRYHQICAVVLFWILLGLIIFTARDVFMIMFGGILFSILLRGIAAFLCQKTPVHNQPLAVGLTLLLLVVLAGVSFILTAPMIGEQIQQLREMEKNPLEQVEEKLLDYEWFQNLYHFGNGEESALSLESLLKGSTNLLRGFFGVFSSTLAVFLIGLFLSLQPDPYYHGFLQLLPRKKQKRMGEVLDRLQTKLRWWLLGKGFSMILIGVLTTLGLMILDVPFALLIGIFAGFVSFIPIIGPLISAIPALAFAFLEGPQTALYVLGLYFLIENLESNLLTPVIQQEAVKLPAAMIIVTQLIFTVVFGIYGLLLATPLAVVILVLTEEFYVKDVLHREA